jgi:selenide,water dikinase
VLSDIPPQADPRILVDFRNADDAGVYRWDGGSALVQTVDFFTPIVDDPFIYGEIAAANALSDVYAMGGRPVTALAIAAFPKNGLAPNAMRSVFLGGFETLRAAGVALLGGHTIQDTEIKFGYAVTGAIDPGRVLANTGVRGGDVLFLTKPLGTGIIATALKFNRASDHVITGAIRSMRTLNRAASEAMVTVAGVHACTDITGFGLAGHAHEMAAASKVTLEIETKRLPILDGAHDLVARNRTGGGATNVEYFSRWVRVSQGVDPILVDLCYDPQTSGGLLVAVDPADADRLAQTFERAGVGAARIGRALDPPHDARVILV